MRANIGVMLASLLAGCVADALDLGLGDPRDAGRPGSPADGGGPLPPPGPPPPPQPPPPVTECPNLGGGSLLLAPGTYERADISAKLDKALVLGGGVLSIYALPEGRLIDEVRGGVTWAAFNDDGSRVVTASQTREGTIVQILDLANRDGAGDRAPIDLGVCEHWITPGRGYLYTLDTCAPYFGDGRFTLGTLRVTRIAGGEDVREVLADQNVKQGSLRASPHGGSLAYSRNLQPINCMCHVRHQSELVRADLRPDGASLHVLANEPDARPIAFADAMRLVGVTNDCGCDDGRLMTWVDGTSTSLGWASRWLAETRVEPLDGIGLWTPGIVPTEMNSEGIAIPELLGHGAGYVRHIQYAGSEARLEGQLDLTVNSPLALIGFGNDTTVLFVDFGNHLFRVAAEPLTEPVEMSASSLVQRPVVSGDRESFAFSVQSGATIDTVGIWLGGPVLAPESVAQGVTGSLIYGYVPGTRDVLLRVQDRLTIARHLYATTTTIDGFVSSLSPPVVDALGCYVLYAAGEAGAGVRITNIR